MTRVSGHNVDGAAHWALGVATMNTLTDQATNGVICVFSRHRPFRSPTHYQTQSDDPISCDGKPVERTNEIAYRIKSSRSN